MERSSLIQSVYRSSFPKSLRMLIYRWRHPEFRLADKLSEISRNGIESFLDWLAAQRLMTGNVLEIGVGGRMQNYGRFSAHAKNYWRSDIRVWPQTQLDVVCDCTRSPFPDHSLDAVICSEVLEHVPDSRSALDELIRIIKPRGLLALTVPFFYPLHGVDADHGDYWRFTPANLKLLLLGDFELVSERRTHMFFKGDNFVVSIQMLWKRRPLPGSAPGEHVLTVSSKNTYRILEGG